MELRISQTYMVTLYATLVKGLWVDKKVMSNILTSTSSWRQFLYRVSHENWTISTVRGAKYFTR